MDVPRRSKRKVSPSKPEEGLTGDALVVTSQRPRKRAKKRSKGRLGEVMSLPVEVFCEIARKLGPHDLLRLARSSRELRNTFMSKSSKWIWNIAEKSVGLPECPPDLSSPQYASLIFDSFCMICNSAGESTQTYFAFRVRICRRCLPDCFKSCFAITPLNDVRSMALLEAVHLGYERYWLAPAYETSGYSQTFTETKFPHLRLILSEQKNGSIYYEPDFQRVYAQYSSLSTVEERHGFAAERREYVNQVKRHAHALKVWVHKSKQSRKADIFNIKVERRNEIYKRLKCLGYKDEDFRADRDEEDWKWKKLVDVAKELTEQAWIKTCPKLEETIRLRRQKYSHIDHIRSARDARHNELTKLVKEAMSSDDGCFVTVEMALQLLPTAQDIMYNTDLSVSFAGLGLNLSLLKDEILDLGKQRMAELTHWCAELLLCDQIDLGPIELPKFRTEEMLCQLATSFFSVRLRPDCEELQVMTFDELVRLVRSEFTENLEGKNKGPFNWKFETRIYAGPTNLVYTLYKALDLSAKTQNDMSRKGSCFICLRCDKDKREEMTWVELVRHYYKDFTEYIPNLSVWCDSWKKYAFQKPPQLRGARHGVPSKHAKIHRGQLACRVDAPKEPIPRFSDPILSSDLTTSRREFELLCGCRVCRINNQDICI